MLEGDEILYRKDEQGRAHPLSKVGLRFRVEHYAGLIHFLQNWTAGIIAMTVEDYEERPAVLFEVKGLWDSVRADRRKIDSAL